MRQKVAKLRSNPNSCHCCAAATGRCLGSCRLGRPERYGENADRTGPTELAVLVIAIGIEGIVQGRPVLVFVVAGAAVAALFLPPRDDHEGIGLPKEGGAVGLPGQEVPGTGDEGFVRGHSGSCSGATI